MRADGCTTALASCGFPGADPEVLPDNASTPGGSTMRLADGIRKHGYRGWYSRELTQAHLRLVLLLLCAVGLFASVELLGREASLRVHLGNAVLLLVCGVVGLWALRRYVFVLMRAEGVARQAVCPGCGTYGRLQLRDAVVRGDRVAVSCRKCAHEWQIWDVADE